MHFIYNLSLWLYYFTLRMASFFNPKARAWIDGRRDWKSHLKMAVGQMTAAQPPDQQRPRSGQTAAKPPDQGRPHSGQTAAQPPDQERPHSGQTAANPPDIIWFHCASLGEFEQGRPIIEGIRNKYPGYRIIVSFFSPSGYAIRKNYDKADAVVYLPLDTPANARDWVDIVNPKLAFFIKYEYWFNFLIALRERNIPMIIASAVFREQQMFYQWYGSWFRAQLENIHWFYVQNETSGKLIQSLGFENVTIAGDTRFDRVKATAASAAEFPLVKKFCGDKPVIMGGSTWAEDEAMMIPLIRSRGKDLRFIIATHDVSAQRIRSMENSLGVTSVRYTELNEENAGNAVVLIIDTIGVLSQMYRYACLAFIGGAYGSGLHNILEAVVFGVPVFFGPKHSKFWEAGTLIAAGGAFEIRSPEEFSQKAVELLTSREKMDDAIAACLRFIDENKGATEVILKGASRLLGD